MPEITYLGHSILGDATVLLGVVETRHTRRWFRKVEISETNVYALKGGFWWGRNNERVPTGPLALRLSEIAMQRVVMASVDEAVGV